MNEIKDGQPDETELLLPWYATGRLPAAEQARIEDALATDEELRRHLAIARDEADETIGLNEQLKTAPAAGLDRIMARIDQYETQHPRRFTLIDKALSAITGAFESLSPRALAWGGVAAAAVICVQAGIITNVLVHRQPETVYKVASADTGETSGTYALVSFVGTASLQQMTEFLEKNHAALLDGPKPGGFYRVRISAEKLSGDALAAKLAPFKAQTDLVQLVLPETPKP